MSWADEISDYSDDVQPEKDQEQEKSYQAKEESAHDMKDEGEMLNQSPDKMHRSQPEEYRKHGKGHKTKKIKIMRRKKQYNRNHNHQHNNNNKRQLHHARNDRITAIRTLVSQHERNCMINLFNTLNNVVYPLIFNESKNLFDNLVQLDAQVNRF